MKRKINARAGNPSICDGRGTTVKKRGGDVVARRNWREKVKKVKKGFVSDLRRECPGGGKSGGVNGSAIEAPGR